MRIFKRKKIKRLKQIKVLKIIILVFIIISSLYLAGKALDLFGAPNNGLVLDLTLSADNYDANTKTFYDQSGYANNGISARDAIFLPGQYGKSEGAMSFNGVNDEVMIPGNVYKKSSITVSFWVKPQNQGRRHVMVTTWPGFTTEINPDGTFKWGLNGVSGNYYGSKQIPWNEWSYLTGTFDDNTKEQCIYINGVLRECQTASGSINYGGANLFVYGSWGRSKAELGGIKIYDRALNPMEIKDLYNDTKPSLQVSSIESGLVAHWPLDGVNYNETSNRVTDVSAYSNHGLAIGATPTEGRDSKINTAFDFGGINDGYAINILNKNFTDLYDFSMSVWVNPHGNHLHYDGTILSSGNWNSDHWSFGLSMENTSIKTRKPYATINYNFIPNNWYHIIYARENNVLSFYVNGILISSVSRNGDTPLASGHSNTKIGMDTYMPNYFNFNGKIADVRIYDRKISDAEVKLLYEQSSSSMSSSSLQKGLVLDMPLTSQYTKGGSAGSEILVDRTPYSHNGQNYGATMTNSYISLGYGLEPLLMDYRLWKDGQSGRIGDFNVYSTGNSRVLAEDPWGRQVPVWKSITNAGIYHNPQPIDNTKLYRMSWWEQRVTNDTATYGRYYAGLNGYGSKNGVLNLNGTYNTNPYFWSVNHSSLTEGQWFLVIGHVFPYSHTGTSSHPDSGRYTIDGFLGNISADYKWAPETATARSRTLAIYQGAPPAAEILHYTVYPRMDVVDGTEPSIQDLLNGHDSYGHDIVVTVPEEKVSVSFWYNDATSNGWRHVVNSSGVLYVDGGLGTPDKYPLVINGDQVYIGRTSMSDFFTGHMANLKIYNRALSASEVEALYDQGRSGAGTIINTN